MVRSKAKQARNSTRAGNAQRKGTAVSVGGTVNRQRRPVRRAAPPEVGTSYSSAPSAVGAINRGVAPDIQHTANGIVVRGEDYVASASALSSTNTSWATVAGFPVCPYSMGSNTLADMCRSYREWRFRKFAVCYIPAIGTTSNGQIALYKKARRADPHLDPTGANFYSFVLNQKTGIVGPVWQPMSVDLTPSVEWMSTIPLESVDVNEECDGEVFLATNNNVATGSSPPVGILKVMYICEFRGFARNPRQSLIPLNLQVYFNTSLGNPANNFVLGTTANFNIYSNDQTGGAAALNTGTAQGDVYKFIIDLGRSFFGAGINNTNAIGETLVGGTRAVTIENGFTGYMVYGGTSFSFYPNIQSAMALSNPYVWGATVAGVNFNLVGMLSLVGNTLARNQLDI